MTKGNGAHRRTLLDTVLDKLAAVDVTRATPPEREPRPGDKVVGKLSPHMIALYVVGMNIADAVQPLAVERDSLRSEVESMLKSSTSLVEIIDALTPEFRAKAARAEQLNQEVVPQMRLAHLVNDILATEIEFLFPETANREIEIDSDWQVIFAKRPKKSAIDGLLAALGGNKHEVHIHA